MTVLMVKFILLWFNPTFRLSWNHFFGSSTNVSTVNSRHFRHLHHNCWWMLMVCWHFCWVWTGEAIFFYVARRPAWWHVDPWWRLGQLAQRHHRPGPGRCHRAHRGEDGSEQWQFVARAGWLNDGWMMAGWSFRCVESGMIPMMAGRVSMKRCSFFGIFWWNFGGETSMCFRGLADIWLDEWCGAVLIHTVPICLQRNTHTKAWAKKVIKLAQISSWTRLQSPWLAHGVSPNLVILSNAGPLQHLWRSCCNGLTISVANRWKVQRKATTP